jgi:hypothetical protein
MYDDRYDRGYLSEKLKKYKDREFTIIQEMEKPC